MIKIAIVDDDFSYLEILYHHIMQYKVDQNLEIQVTSYSHGFDLMSDFKPIYDIVFLDIEMPHLNGIEVAKEIRKSDPHVVIIFITNSTKYAVSGYEVQAYDYMMKPLTYEQFSVKFSSALSAIVSKEAFSILLPHDDGSRNVAISEILYIEIRNHWLHIITFDSEYKMLGSLKEMNDMLSEYHFIMCNKSYLINLKHISKLTSENVILNGNHELKLSRSRRKAVQSAFIEYYQQIKW